MTNRNALPEELYAPDVLALASDMLEAAELVTAGQTASVMREQVAALTAQRDDLLGAVKGALSALDQNKTFPADVNLAKNILITAIARAGGAR